MSQLFIAPRWFLQGQKSASLALRFNPAKPHETLEPLINDFFKEVLVWDGQKEQLLSQVLLWSQEGDVTLIALSSSLVGLLEQKQGSQHGSHQKRQL